MRPGAQLDEVYPAIIFECRIDWQLLYTPSYGETVSISICMPAAMSLAIALIVFFLGACIGSFLNVVIYRLPAEQSLLRPPSRCPQCHHRLKPYDNVPVLGWLWLRGKCRYCKAAIAIRYPLIEAATGLLFLIVLWHSESPLMIVGGWIFVSWLIALAFIDLDTLTLPNPLTQSGLVLGVIFQGILGWYDGGLSGTALHLMGSISAAVLGIWLFDIITIFGSTVYGQAVMGGGDAKLAAMMGAWLGWQQLLLAAFLACVLGAIVGSAAIALKLIQRRQPIPFGPFLALAAFLAAIWGDAILSAYLSLYFSTL